MTPSPVHVTVTGAAGQIGYQLVFRIASGQLLGTQTPVVLRLLEVEPAMRALEGVVMELDDGAFPLLAGVEATSDLKVAFDAASWALLVGSVPRKAGMERGDLLSVNGGIFKPQGEAIAAHAASDVRVLVVGNPCNTNCLIARTAARDVPADRFFAMTRLDQNRAVSQLAARAGVPVTEVANLAVFGNHSATQFPDFENATVGGVPATKAIDEHWLQDAFLTAVQQRGAAIIEARGASSAASAASAALDTVVSLTTPTPADTCVSVAVTASGEYGATEGLTFGLPIVADGAGGWSVKEGFEHSGFAKGRIAATTEELVEERDAVRALGLV